MISDVHLAVHVFESAGGWESIGQAGFLESQG